MTHVLGTTLQEDLKTHYHQVVAELDALERLALELKDDPARPLLTPDLTELRETVLELAHRLACANTGHLVNSVSNIEEYLRSNPGAAVHHLRELRRKLIFAHWPIGRQLFALLPDLAKVEELLETQPAEHIADVIEDLRGSRRLQKFVRAEHQPGVVRHCIEAETLYGDDPAAALQGYS